MSKGREEAVVEKAWKWRKEAGHLQELEALRLFQGPGEAESNSIFSHYAVDRFGPHLWVTEWKSKSTPPAEWLWAREKLVSFYRPLGFESGVILSRPEGGELPSESEILFGSPPADGVVIQELKSRFKIKLTQTRHPGLFLDHLPLRKYLECLGSRAQGLRVLNTFAYTGSLSVAARQGGATHVTTLDLSRPSIEWAKDNMKLNGFEDDRNRWMVGDVFDILPRLKRAQEKYDCVILDPPSFSRGQKGAKALFSTQKDLTRLHSLAIELLAEGGLLMTSLNSSNVSWEKYAKEITLAFSSQKMRFMALSQIDLPETFPTSLSDPSQRYLKGWILKRL